jgi:hypothetical protein
VVTSRVIASLTAPDPTIVVASIKDQDITDQGGIEPGTVANVPGLCSANPIEDTRLWLNIEN